MRSLRTLLLAFSATCVLTFGADGQATTPSVALVIANDADALEQYAASELQRYLTQLFGVTARIVPLPDETADNLFFVGTTHDIGTMVSNAAIPLSDQGFLLRSFQWKVKPSFAVVGGSPVATLWGVYELVERYGVRYLLSGDVFPEFPKEPLIPQIDRTFEPVFRIRMWKTMGDFAMGMEGWGMAEYRPFIDQLAKLKFNRIRVSSGPSQPFLGLNVRGVKNSSATLWYGARFPITDDMPGRALFGEATEFWNPDLPLPDVGSDALIAAGERHCHELIEYAHSRGIDSNFVGSLTDFPKEFAGVLPETRAVQQLGELTVSPGPSVRPDDPVLVEVAGTVLRTLVDTFPDADSYGFPVGTEWPSWIDLYQSAWQELNARYHIEEVMSLDDVLESASQRTEFTGGAERAVMQVKGDLAGLCFLDVLRSSADILPKSRKPDAKFVYYEVAEELCPILPRVLPKDAELLVVLDYTPTRVLRRPEAFDKLPAKEIPTILAVTLQDDGVGVPPQLTTGSLHKLVGLMRDHGLAGFCTRQWMISDLDPSVAYLAKAAWDPATTPDSAYRDHITAVFGDAAVESLLEVFREIEAVTIGLEDHGLGLGFPVPNMMMRYWTPGPFPNTFAEDRAGYERALAALRKAPAPQSEAGRAGIAYWTGRLQFAIGFFDTLELIGKAATAEQAAKDAKQQGDDVAFVTALTEAVEPADAAQKRAYQAIDTLASVAKNQSDRGAVATLAEYAYRPLKQKATELRAALPATPTARHTLGECILEADPPVEVGRAAGHHWFASLHSMGGSDVLCEVVLSDDKAQGKWPATLYLSRDNGASWKPVLNIDCYGPTSTVLEPRKILLMPYETWPESPQDKRNAKAEGTTVTLGEDGVLAAEPAPMKFQGFPRDLAEYNVNEVYLLTNGNILALSDGRLFTTVYGKFAGDTKDSCWSVTSQDGGRTWQYQATVANGQELAGAPEGANESNTCRLADGRLLTVYRTGGAYHASRSSDEGATWSAPEPMQGVSSVEPQLVRLESGVLVLSGGRPGLFVWVCSDGEGRKWQQFNLAEHHNRLVQDSTLHYTEDFCAARGTDPPESTSYTGMLATGPEEVLICYDRVGNGWNGAPGPRGPTDAIFSVRLKVMRNDH
ncbi:MAG: exo-alpha-sialidase [Candidatus Hydrogenedentes bacterium]|nr:exo-alpha-sialidase [Candidatus Hydrogenedentota bacterium]